MQIPGNNRALVSFAAVGLAGAFFSAACSSDDPVFDDLEVDGGGGNLTPADATPGGGGDSEITACFTTPSRLIVLGDSISACVNVGGKDGAECSPKMFHTYLEANYASGVSYENLSVGGALTADVPNRQLPSVTTGQPGHALVLIFVGGNDLQPYIFASDEEAQRQYDAIKPQVIADWERIDAFFTDPVKFPDGASVIMNTQYNPFDDCTASPFYLSALKTTLLHKFNDELIKASEERENAVITDQHGPYLGHGHHYQVQSCPHYKAGADNWMADTIHPNASGHASLAAQWTKAADLLFRDNCN